MKSIDNLSKQFLVFLLAVNFLLVLFFGLNPRDFSSLNRVDWIEGQPGIHFRKYGMAHTHLFIEKPEEDTSDSKKFSVQIALKPEDTGRDGFKFIFVLHTGQDSNQPLMAQWRSWMILMNGDDYSNRRRTKRIALNTALLPAGPLFLTMTTDSESTRLYSGRQLVAEKKGMTLDLPDGEEARLVLGSSVYGKHSWDGFVYGLALYRFALTDHNIAIHFDKWEKERDFSFAKTDNPFALFLFDEKQGRRALDHSGRNRPLIIPEKIGPLEREFLVSQWEEFRFNKRNMMDIAMNFLGFVPFGFFLAAALTNLGGHLRKRTRLVTVGLCLTVSLLIEIIQAWLPSRASSLSDLTLNVFGGWIGSAIYTSRWGVLYDVSIRSTARRLLLSRNRESGGFEP